MVKAEQLYFKWKNKDLRCGSTDERWAYNGQRIWQMRKLQQERQWNCSLKSESNKWNYCDTQIKRLGEINSHMPDQRKTGENKRPGDEANTRKRKCGRTGESVTESIKKRKLWKATFWRNAPHIKEKKAIEIQALW